jgi:hypothetical protein
MAEAAWISTRPVLRHLTHKPKQLVIGLRGGMAYRVAWTGPITDDPLQDPDHRYSGTDTRFKLFPTLPSN